MIALCVLAASCGPEGPTEQSALAFVDDPSNIPAFEAEGFTAFNDPREALDAAIDGECAAVVFQQEGREIRDTAFLRWQDGEWVPQDIVTGGNAFSWLDGAGERCYERPNG